MSKIITGAIISLALIHSADSRERSQKAKDDFKYSHPCPSNGNNHGACPDYVIDHITALACGGADNPSNMQWQSIAEGKAKDKWERKGCQANSISSIGNSNNESEAYQIGSRGGCFYYDSVGKKKYVAHSKCGL